MGQASITSSGSAYRSSPDEPHRTSDEPVRCICNLLLQMLAVRQLGEEVQFAPNTDRLDPVAVCLVVVDAPPIQPRVGRFMDDRGGDLLKRRCFRENKTLIKYASV